MDYDFVDEATFRRMRDEGHLVEWAEVHGHLYGTPRRNIEEAAERGEHVVLDIDVQGARQIREHVPDALLVFVLPPSADALVARLSGRDTEARTEMLRRLRNAREELLAVTDFDRAVVNEVLAKAVDGVRALVRGEEPSPDVVPDDVEAEVERIRRGIDVILGSVGSDGPIEAGAG